MSDENDRRGLAEKAIWLLMRGLTSLPDPLLRLAPLNVPTEVEGAELEPEVRFALALMRLDGDDFSDHSPKEARAIIRREALTFGGPLLPVDETHDHGLPGPGGDIPVRVYRHGDSAAGTRPLVVYFHGGGWVTGDLDTHDAFCRFLARETRFVVMAVHYRLAPEDPFPAAVEDAVAAFRWAHANPGEIGIDPDRIAVAGDSAGANLSAVVSQVTSAEHGPSPAMQALVYPATDLANPFPSHDLFADGYFLTKKQMDWYKDHYVPVERRTDPLASPLLAEDLAGLPPAYVTTAGFDVLRDEGEAYAAALEKAGVETELIRHPGLIHGWVNATSLGRTPREAGDGLVAALRAGLG